MPKYKINIKGGKSFIINMPGAGVTPTVLQQAAKQMMMKDAENVLDKYRGLDFVNRIHNPGIAPTPIFNPDGSVSTHRMAAEIDEDTGDWFAFPTIINKGGKLEAYEDAREAMEENRRRGELIPFGKNKASAINFARNYKESAPEMKQYQPQTRRLRAID